MNTQTIGCLKFRFEDQSYQKIDDLHWYDIYNNVVLESGERVSQVSVSYNFNAPTGALISVYFETSEGTPPTVSLDTVGHLTGAIGAVEVNIDD